jgi:hypothetical protein
LYDVIFMNYSYKITKRNLTNEGYFLVVVFLSSRLPGTWPGPESSFCTVEQSAPWRHILAGTYTSLARCALTSALSRVVVSSTPMTREIDIDSCEYF